MITDRENFIDYLTATLIPDLRESGHEATADDFETCVGWLTSNVIELDRNSIPDEGMVVARVIVHDGPRQARFELRLLASNDSRAHSHGQVVAHLIARRGERGEDCTLRAVTGRFVQYNEEPKP